jgi:hypothetical protein
MSMSIKELASDAEKRLAERHQRQQEKYGEIKLEILEEILRMSEIDTDLRSALVEWVIRSRRLVKADQEREELNANSWERLSLPLAVIFFSALTWIAQVILVAGAIRNTAYVIAFGWSGILWWIARSKTLEAIAGAKKRLTLMGKVE